jgi:hypothetical protein
MIDHQGRIGLLLAQCVVECEVDRLHIHSVQSALLVHRCKAGAEQHRILLSQGHVECRSKVQHHAAAGPAPARFQEAQMPLRKTAVECELELARTARLAPLAQHVAEAGRGCGRFSGRDRHGSFFLLIASAGNYPRGNCDALAQRHDDAPAPSQLQP